MSFKAMIDGEPSLKKPAKKSTSNPSLPDDLVVSCLARVSRLYYPTLSFVSKSFRSLLASPELYKTRSLLKHTEICLYVCLKFPPDPKLRWFTLCLKPNKTLISKKESSCHYLLVPISNHNSPQVDSFTLAAIGHKLYVIWGSMEDGPRSNVSFLDCRTNTWLKAPTLRLAHTGTRLDGRMYLPGSYENLESLNCVEVFDTKTQTWKPVPPEKRKYKPRDMEGKIYMNKNGVSNNKVLVLSPNEAAWETLGLGADLDAFIDKEAEWEMTKLGTYWDVDSAWIIDNIAYLVEYNGEFKWCDTEIPGGGLWSKLEGLEGLPKFPNCTTVKLADYGGKLAIFWDDYVPASGFHEKMIWCAVISLEKRSSKEIWGKVEWFDAVLTVPKSYKLVCAITATV